MKTANAETNGFLKPVVFIFKFKQFIVYCYVLRNSMNFAEVRETTLIF